MTDTKYDTNRWKHIPCSWAKRINIVTMTVLLRTIYRLIAIPVKLLMALFTKLEQKS